MRQRERAKKLLEGDDAFGFSLLATFLDEFAFAHLQTGEIAEVHWRPETIILEMQSAFNATLSGSSYEKLMTAIDIFTTNRFFTNVRAFSRSSAVLSGNVPLQNVFSLPSVEEIAWGVTEALLISPPDNDTDRRGFSEEIAEFVNQTLKREGLLQAPEVLADLVPDYQRSVSYGFSDDPAIFSAVQSLEDEKRQQVEYFVRVRMVSLLSQVEGLELVKGNGKAVGNLANRVGRNYAARP